MPARLGEKAHTVAEAERMVVVKPKEKVHTAAEIERHHAAIRKALKPEDARQFQWIAETGTVQSYRHTATGRHLHIDNKGFFYNQEGRPATEEAALKHAMPEAWKHAQNEHRLGMGMGR